MKRAIVAIIGFGLLAVSLTIWQVRNSGKITTGYFNPPDGALLTYFPAEGANPTLPVVISSSVEAGFMRPFLLAFQKHNSSVPITYIQSRSNAFFKQALDSCHGAAPTADIYISASTDHLVRLANENCARSLPPSVGDAAPAHAAWRNQVVAFTVEPASFVFGRDFKGRYGPAPTSHVGLLEWLRRSQPEHDRVGTYDIESSADGYNFSASDSRQTSLYGRLIESLGRADVRLYCCSNVMVDAVDRGDILFAYNVQLSYAYAAQRAGSRITVVLPQDYQAIQTVSLMVPKGARSEPLAGELAAFLVSPEARALAKRDLSPPDQPASISMAQADRLLGQASVTPLLLSLQDNARRGRLIHEWREAIRPGQPPQMLRAATPHSSPSHRPRS
jgi:iron(III) transport system substrate-binding protein